MAPVLILHPQELVFRDVQLGEVCSLLGEEGVCFVLTALTSHSMLFFC
jgi:hypothetical protein